MKYLIIKYKFALLITACLVITSIIYFPGLKGGFHLDDYPNILHNSHLVIEEISIPEIWQSAWSGSAGPLKRPIAMLSFGLNTYFSGVNAYPMKLTNLVVHLLTGVILILISRIILSRWKQDNVVSLNPDLIAVLVGFCWLIPPFNLTPVLYIVQRMTSLASLFALLSLLSYCHLGTTKLTVPRALILNLCMGISSVLALYSKEIAVLIPFQILVIELCVFRFKYTKKIEKYYLISFYSICVALPLTFLLQYFFVHFETLENAFLHREFTMQERVLTESRIVLWYLKMTLVPNLNHMGLILDSFPLSKTLFDPAVTIIFISTIIGLLSLALFTIPKYPFIAFGIFWFFVSHTLESSILNLDLAYEHRNYLASYGILILLISCILYFLRSKRKRRFAFSLCIAWILALGLTTHLRVGHWGNILKLAIHDVENHPESEKAHLILSQTYETYYLLEKDEKRKSLLFAQALNHIDKASLINPQSLRPKTSKIFLLSLKGEKPTKNELVSLTQSLQTGVIDSSTTTTLQQLTRCIFDKNCTLDSQTYITIMASALSNPAINSEYKSHLLIQYSRYFSYVLSNHQDAEAFCREAIEINPGEINLRSFLIKLLIRQGKTNEAIEELIIFKEKDTKNIHLPEIIKLEKILQPG